MTTKTRVGLFLMTGLVLALAAIYTLPMQQATACGKSCGGGGGGGDDCCGGSLVNVEKNKVGNVKTGDVLSGNKIKALNDNNIGNFKALNDNKIGNLKDVNVLSKNILKDINVLSKNTNNIGVSEIANDIGSYNEHFGKVYGIGNPDVNDNYVPVLNDNVQLSFKKLINGLK